MTPSPVIKQLNDKKFLLPSDYELKYNVHLRGERPKSNINTAQRVFTEYVLTNNNAFNDNIIENETNSNFKKTTSYFNYKPVDSIGNLISYKFGPEFKEQVNIINKNFLIFLMKLINFTNFKNFLDIKRKTHKPLI